MTPHEIIASACQGYGVTRDDVLGHSRNSELCVVRREIAKALRALGYSMPAIGRLMGGRHHTTVLEMLQWKRRKGDAWRTRVPVREAVVAWGAGL